MEYVMGDVIFRDFFDGCVVDRAARRYEQVQPKHAHTNTHARMHTHTRTRTHAHTHARTHTHTHTQPLW